MTIRRCPRRCRRLPGGATRRAVALDLATGWHARLRFVTVTTDHSLGALLDTAAADGGAAERIEDARRALLRYLTDTARTQGLDIDAVLLGGEPFRQILDQARSWQADLIVMGRSDRRGPSSPYLGSETAHVLEFADCPVLVVPRTSTADPGQ